MIIEWVTVHRNVESTHFFSVAWKYFTGGPAKK